MATLREMAVEYRIAAAKLKIRIKEKKDSGVSEEELKPLRYILQDIREVQRLLDGYYDVPRSGEFAAVGWKARGPGNDY